MTGMVAQQQQPSHSSKRMLVDSLEDIIISCEEWRSDFECVFCFLYYLIVYGIWVGQG